MSMILRKDNWSSWEDKVLIETVIEFANNLDTTQQDAFEAAAAKLKDRSVPAVSARWHAQLKHKVLANATLPTKDIAETVPDKEEPTSPEYLDLLLSGNLKSRTPLNINGLYLNDVNHNLLNYLASKGGRGAKSKITNDAFTKYFRDKGLI